jgi:4-amino-4-deoxy-L-arabinose transferase-like glycosyltransferase
MCSFILAIWLYIKTFELRDNFSKLLFIIFLVIIPYFIYYNLYFSSEPISFLLLALAFYLVPKSHDEIDLKNLFLIGLATGLLIANRPNFVLFLPIMIFIISFTKERRLFLIVIFSFITLIAVNQLYRFNDKSLSKDKVVFLLEQIHGGQFFLNDEFTDWSFFNNEYREKSIDYQNFTQSKELILTQIESGLSPREAYLNEIINQYKQHFLKSTVHPIKKFIHGNSIHIGSKVSGKLSIQYLKKYWLIFSINIILNTLNWLIISIGLYFLFKYYKEQEILNIIIIATLLSFNIFNMISASEQRYLFPTKIIYLILAIKFIVRYYSGVLPQKLNYLLK